MSHLILKVVPAHFTTKNKFVWPKEVGAKVVAPDWEDTEECGNGLHGWRNGQGDLDCTDYWKEPDCVWLVIDVESYIELEGKVKFKEGTILYVGNVQGAAALIHERTGEWSFGAVVPAGIIAPALGTSTSGDCGTSTSGYRGTSTSGEGGTSTSGYRGTAISGDCGTATSGNCGTIVIKYYNNQRYRLRVGYIGEDGLKPNVAYKLDENHNFIEAGESK